VDPQYETYFMSPFWHREFWCVILIFGKFVQSCFQKTGIPDQLYFNNSSQHKI